jgi:uncharacterized protein YlbG (UPF0298 family)
MNMVERLGLVVWINDLDAARALQRWGHIHYISKRLKYVYLYIDEKTADEVIVSITQLPFVKKVEPSQRKKVSLDFENPL